MTPERLERIEQAIAEAEAAGEVWTNLTVYQRVGGNYAQLAQYLKQRRAHHDAPVAVVELEPEPAWSEYDIQTTSPLSPLAEARRQRDQTAQAEQTLGREEQTLKVQRQALEQQRLTLETSAAIQTSDADDLERRRRLRELHTALMQVEHQRHAVHAQRRQVAAELLEMREAYAMLHGQAARWLRRLRESQRTAQAGVTALERGDSREEVEQAVAQLTRLVGETEAQALAADSRQQPGWLTE